MILHLIKIQTHRQLPKYSQKIQKFSKEKKCKNEDVTFIKQVPLHLPKKLQRLAEIDEKVHFIKERASTKPKKFVQTKRKINKMKNINDQVMAANKNTDNLMLGEFNFDTKKILNKTDRIIDAINNPYNDEYWIEHKPGTNCFTLRLEDGR